jgi:hypothetical protein
MDNRLIFGQIGEIASKIVQYSEAKNAHGARNNA